MTATPADAEPGRGHGEMSASRRSRWPLRVAVFGAVAAAGVLAVVVTPHVVDKGSAVRSPLLGHRAPAFDLADLRVSSTRVRFVPPTGRVTVVNFWASWCVPCRQEMPALERVHQRFVSCVAFVGIDHADLRPDALELERVTGVPYRSGFDPRGTVAASYGLAGLPSTVVVDGDGEVAWVHLGAVDEGKLGEVLKRLTAGVTC